jgi:hypothetical protein
MLAIPHTPLKMAFIILAASPPAAAEPPQGKPAEHPCAHKRTPQLCHPLDRLCQEHICEGFRGRLWNQAEKGAFMLYPGLRHDTQDYPVLVHTHA